MLDKQYSLSQIDRLEGLQGFPAGKGAAIKELVMALQCFGTNQAAQRFVNAWLQYETYCPVPSHIRKAAFDEIGARRHEQDDPQGNWGPIGDLCPDCKEWGAFGWIKREGRYEQCPGSHDSSGERDSIQILVDVMNQAGHGRKKTGSLEPARSFVGSVVAS